VAAGCFSSTAESQGWNLFRTAEIGGGGLPRMDMKLKKAWKMKERGRFFDGWKITHAGVHTEYEH
jgi:hypothetical protein